MHSSSDDTHTAKIIKAFPTRRV